MTANPTPRRSTAKPVGARRARGARAKSCNITLLKHPRERNRAGAPQGQAESRVDLEADLQRRPPPLILADADARLADNEAKGAGAGPGRGAQAGWEGQGFGVFDGVSLEDAP